MISVYNVNLSLFHRDLPCELQFIRLRLNTLPATGGLQGASFAGGYCYPANTGLCKSKPVIVKVEIGVNV